MKYEKPMFSVIALEAEDIITTSRLNVDNYSDEVIGDGNSPWTK